ncbi:MAG: ABC transporter permease, partial [Pseudomonadota bacterium]
MEIRPILSAMWRNRTGSVLVALQIALTLAIVVNCLFLAATRTEFIGRDSGIDTQNIIAVASMGFGSNYDHSTTLTDDLELIRSLPGVVAATSSNHIPLSGSGSASGFRASMEEDAPRASANYFHFDHQAEQALGVKIIEGRGFYESEMISANSDSLGRMPGQVVISQALAERLYPDEPALGKPVFNNLGESATIVGIVELMFGT